MNLTLRQRQVLDFIREHTKKHQRPPTYREIGEHFGFGSTNATRSHIRALTKKGAIEVEPRAARGIHVNDMQCGIPILTPALIRTIRE